MQLSETRRLKVTIELMKNLKILKEHGLNEAFILGASYSCCQETAQSLLHTGSHLNLVIIFKWVSSLKSDHLLKKKDS